MREILLGLMLVACGGDGFDVQAAPTQVGAAGAGGQAGAASAGAAGLAKDAGHEEAGSPCPDGMTLVQDFCIDSHEVTNAEYDEFLGADNHPDQIAVCAWNTDVTRDDCPSTGPEASARCLDWCDAETYCAWSGKRLCGKIDGGENSMDDYADVTKSQWYAACDGGHLDPIGSSVYEWEDSCNDDEVCLTRRTTDCGDFRAASRSVTGTSDIGFRCCSK